MNERNSYIVLAPFCWGKAKTDHEAYRNCVSNISGYATGEVKFVCLYVTEGSYVNEMGGINRPADDPDALKVWEREVNREVIDEFNAAMDLINYGTDKHEVKTTYYDEDGNEE